MKQFIIRNLIRLAKKKKPNLPKIKNVNINLKNFPKNLKIVQLTDLHMGEFTDSSYIEYIIKAINSQSPDLIVITGDLISEEVEYIKEELNLLKKLKAKYGKFAVLGNREVEFNDETIFYDLFASVEITLLDDSFVKLTVEEKEFALAGIHDTNGIKCENLKANLEPPSILLTHQPKSSIILKHIPTIDLILCGHTHGGQVNPFGKIMLKQQNQPFFKGLFKVGNSKVYVSEGAGYTLVPLRFLTTGEITSITINKE